MPYKVTAKHPRRLMSYSIIVPSKKEALKKKKDWKKYAYPKARITLKKVRL